MRKTATRILTRKTVHVDAEYEVQAGDMACCSADGRMRRRRTSDRSRGGRRKERRVAMTCAKGPSRPASRGPHPRARGPEAAPQARARARVVAHASARRDVHGVSRRVSRGGNGSGNSRNADVFCQDGTTSTYYEVEIETGHGLTRRGVVDGGPYIYDATTERAASRRGARSPRRRAICRVHCDGRARNRRRQRAQ